MVLIRLVEQPNPIHSRYKIWRLYKVSCLASLVRQYTRIRYWNQLIKSTELKIFFFFMLVLFLADEFEVKNFEFIIINFI